VVRPAAGHGAPVAWLIAQFVYLQVLDLLSTLAFLVAGASELNPCVRWLMLAAGSPLGGLVAAKLFAVALGLYCWRGGRRRVLAGANVFYALLVAWNLAAFVLRAAAPAVSG
jgi:hypothetical protein